MEFELYVCNFPEYCLKIKPRDNMTWAGIRSTHFFKNFYEAARLFENQYNVKIYRCFNGDGVFLTTLDYLDVIYKTTDNDKFYIILLNVIYKHNNKFPLTLQNLCIKNIVTQCSTFHEIVHFKPILPKLLFHKLIRKGMCYTQISERNNYPVNTNFRNFIQEHNINNPIYNVKIDFEETVIPKWNIVYI